MIKHCISPHQSTISLAKWDNSTRERSSSTLYPSKFHNSVRWTRQPVYMSIEKIRLADSNAENGNQTKTYLRNSKSFLTESDWLLQLGVGSGWMDLEFSVGASDLHPQQQDNRRFLLKQKMWSSKMDFGWIKKPSRTRERQALYEHEDWVGKKINEWIYHCGWTQMTNWARN